MGKLFLGFKKAFIKWHNNLPGAKQHLDALVALLTIALTVSVLLINLKNLQTKPTTTTPADKTQIVVTIPPANNSARVVTSKPNNDVCKKAIAPIQITSPEEGDSVSDNPVCITISYNQGDYCSAVWSYRFNSGSWSNYANDSPCLASPTPGTITFDLLAKSLVTNQTVTLHRTFTYAGPTPTTVLAPTNAATITPTVTTTAH